MNPLAMPGVRKQVCGDLRMIEKSARAIKMSVKAYPKACPSNETIQALLGQMIATIELTKQRLRDDA
jgi:hypothetical protein